MLIPSQDPQFTGRKALAIIVVFTLLAIALEFSA